MSEIERAIKDFEHFKEMGYTHSCLPSSWSIEVALAALREKQERDKGCEHCKVLTAEHCTGFLLPSADPDCEADMVTISHCPMCGKRLEVEP